MRVAMLEFKFPVDFKNGYMAECKYPLEDKPSVMIWDIAKDDRWATDTVAGNPKHQTMSIEKFNKTFKITHITDKYNG